MIPDSCPSAARVIRRKPRRRWAGAAARGGCRSETGGGCPAASSVEPISENEIRRFPFEIAFEKEDQRTEDHLGSAPGSCHSGKIRNPAGPCQS